MRGILSRVSYKVYRILFMIEICFMIVYILNLIKNIFIFRLASHCVSPVSSVIGLKWEIRGQQYLQKEEASVIVSNHQSSLDILGMFHIWPIMGKCTVIAKKELFYIWPFGLAAWLSGLIFINRVNSNEAKSTMNNCTDKLIKEKTKLWIFPEGTRYNDGEIHPFKKGAFHVAINSGMPIIPVVFTAYKTFLDSKLKEFKSGNHKKSIEY